MKQYLMNIFWLCPLLLLWQHGYGQIVFTTNDKTYSSVNPKSDVGITKDDLLHLNLAQLFSLNQNDLQGGILADAQGGNVKLSVYYYKEEATDGKGALIYRCLTAQNSEAYVEHPEYFEEINWLALINPFSSSKISWWSTDIKKIAIRAGLDNPNTFLNCDEFGCKQLLKSIPVIIEVTGINATLHKFKIPVLGEFDADIFFNRYTMTKKRFANPKGYCNYVTYASHRGEKRNYPENSPQAIQEAINLGVDMVEIDLDRTKDGVILGVHLGELGHYVTGDGYLKDKNYYKDGNKGNGDVFDKIFPIDRLGRAWNGTNGTEKINLATLEELLPLCKGKVMVHLDKCADYIDKVVAISDKLGMTGDLIFKGTYTPDALYDKYKGKNVLGRINYSPVLFTDQLNDKAWDPYKEVANVPGWCSKLGLGSGCTWNQVINKFLDDTRIGTSIDGFELNWFNEFETEEIALRAATTHIRDRNKHVIPFPNTPEHYEGWWNKGGKEKPASGNVNDWRRYYPVNDQRANWDMWFDKATNDGKPIPTMIIDDNTIQMMNYLQARGFRNPAPNACPTTLGN